MKCGKLKIMCDDSEKDVGDKDFMIKICKYVDDDISDDEGDDEEDNDEQKEDENDVANDE